MDRTYSETLEAVYQAYENTLDLDVAFNLVGVPSAQRPRLLEDPDLSARTALCDSKVKEELIERLRGLSSATNEAVRLQALKELGRTLYPKRFKEGGAPSTMPLKRLKKVPDDWPDEYVEMVKKDAEDYVDSSDFPTEAEFCYTRGITIKKLDKYLKDLRELMAAKRQAMLIKRGWNGDDPLGTFLTKLAANAGDFSLVDKHELGGPNGEPIEIALIKRVVVDGK